MWARIKRAGMVASFAAFTLIGLAMALFGEGTNRLMGIATAAFFGVGGAAWFLITAPRGRVPGFRRGHIGHFGGTRPAFIADYARGSTLVGGVALIGMAVAALLLFIVSWADASTSVLERALPLGAALLFGGVGIRGLVTAGAGGRLALTRDGVHLLGAGEVFVPWEAITDIGQMTVHDNAFLALRVHSPDAIRMGTLQRLAHAVQRSTMGVDVTVPLRPLLVEPAELVATLERYRTAPEARAAIGSMEELATVRRTGSDPQRT